MGGLKYSVYLDDGFDILILSVIPFVNLRTYMKIVARQQDFLMEFISQKLSNLYQNNL